MPNYKLSHFNLSDLESAARQLVSDYVTCMRYGFPLTKEEVQAATVDPEVMDHFRALADRGVDNIGKVSNVQVKLLRQDYPELQRNVVLQINTDLYYDKTYSRVYFDSQWSRTCDDLPSFNHLLPADSRERLVKWCNEVVRANRLKEMANITITALMQTFRSTGDVLANWPMLASLATDVHLKKRFANPPVKLDRYKRNLGALLKSPKQLEATNVLFNMALLTKADTPKIKPDPEGHVLVWEKFDTDPKFS